MEYFPVYKVCYLKKDGVFRTYQFSGKSNDSKNSTETVKVVKQQIYLDDTILDIKLKVMEELKLDDIFVTANEMYIFNQAQVMLNADIVYEVVKKKGCLKCFLDNLTQVNSNEPFQYDLPAEDEYDLDDIIRLNLNGPFLVDRLLGHKELTDSASKLVCNPFKLSPPRTDDEGNSLGGGSKSNSLNNYRLFDCGDIANNVLFVCLAEDVMSLDDSIGQLYFPLLSENKKKRERHYLNVRNQSKMKLWNDIKRYTPNKLTFVSPWGIKLIHLTITQSVEQSIPLDLIFKNIHSQSMTPIIKYIPSDEKESLYRLHCDNKAEDGTLIPQLDLTQINTYVNELTTTQKNITFLFQQNGLDIICTLNKRGDMNLKCDFQNTIKPLSDVQDMISNAVKFVTTTTSNLITDGGFKIAHFSTLFDESVVIERLLYSCEVKRETNVNNASLMRYLSCFKNIFTDEDNSHGPNETHLIYKRVSPHAHGIKTHITWMNSGKNVEVNIHDVINIRYLQTIPIYIESMLLVVFQKLSDEQYPTLSDLNRVCNDESTSNSFGGQGDDAEVDNHIQVDSDAEGSADYDEDDDNNDTLLDSDSESSESSNTEETDDANATQMDSDNETETEKELIPLPLDESAESEYESSENPTELLENETLEDSDDSELEEDKKKYVEHKIFKLDPLIISEKTSEVCSSNKPVVVTDGELEVIQKNYPINKKDVLRYGSPASKTKNNYLCPMYWCPKLNIPISAEEIQTKTVNGVKQFSHPSCGKVIERTSQINNKTDGIIEMGENYQRRPALTNCSKGFCVPCCVKKDDPAEAEEVLITDVNNIVDENTRLKNTQLGYVPDHIRHLFGVHKYDRKTTELSLLKPNKPYLLRVGVEGNEPQSFLACISRALALRGGIRELKSKIVEAIDIDRFIRCQNGNLVSDFQDSIEDINKHDVQFNNKIEMYKTSTIYQKVNMKDLAEKLYFKQVVSALLNFTRFLNNETNPIDYTYLWDILCVPNNKLFKNGINLIILVSNPVKNTVQLMCPTNHYSSEFYDPIKETLFLLRVDEDDDDEPSNGMYNPIGLYRKNNNNGDEPQEEDKVRILLSEAKDALIMPILKNLIKPHIKECRAHESLPEMTPLAPMFLSILVKEIQKYDYQVTQQVLGYNNKVVGILVQSREGATGFVPCFPSGLLFNTKLDFVFISHQSVWQPYSATVDFLTEVSNKSNRRIPCRPDFRVIQMSKIVVGILTESKQFVQISLSLNIEEATTGNLKNMFTDAEYVEISDNKMGSTEKSLFITDTKDLERENYISRVKSEDNFYITFKNTVRILLNNYENQKLKKEVYAILSQNDMIYQDKLIKVEKIIRQLVGKKVQFTGNDSYYKLIKTVSACIGNDKDECSSNLCGFTDGDCNLIVPRNNLISPQKKNENIYFRRLTDELIRNARIRAYLFRRQTAEGLGSLTYIINEDEVILTESTIHSYMTNLKPPAADNPANFNSFDEAIPSKSSLPYSNTINVNNLKTTSTNKCESISKRIISGDKWNTYFPPDYHEITYGKTVNCSFDFAIFIIKSTTNVALSKSEIKIQLIEEYSKYTGEYEEKIRLILKLEGKPLAMNTNLSIWTIIQEAGYFLTALDLWLLLERHQIPFVFLSHSRIVETVKQRKILSGFTTKDKECVFIVLPSYSSPSAFSFKVIQNNEDTVAISLKDFKTFNTKTRADLTPIPMDEFVKEILSKSAQNNTHNNNNKNAIEQALEVFDMNVVLSIVDKTKTRKNKFFKRGTKKREV